MSFRSKKMQVELCDMEPVRALKRYACHRLGLTLFWASDLLTFPFAPPF